MTYLDNPLPFAIVMQVELTEGVPIGENLQKGPGAFMDNPRRSTEALISSVISERSERVTKDLHCCIYSQIYDGAIKRAGEIKKEMADKVSGLLPQEMKEFFSR